MRLNGTLMSADKAVAKIEDGNVIPIIKALMPIYLQRTGDFEGWLADRAIDRHRTNSRLLKKALRLTNAKDVEVVLRVHAATITDNYWFKEIGSLLVYEDVRFKENMFDKLALYGDPDSFNHPESSTPELTNIGSYEKCWRLTDGKWWLYKQGNDKERFSELFIAYLGEALGFSMAHYEPEGEYIKSLDYTGQRLNYEPMYSLIGEEEDYQKNFEILQEICPAAARDYVKMIFLDTVCFNMDRHTKNYGILRDRQTGETVGLAPNFDNNIALISRGYPRNIDRTNDRLIALFTEFLEKNKMASQFYEEIDTTVITEETIHFCIEKTGISADASFICAFISNGINQVQEILQHQFMQQEEQGQNLL